MIGHVARFEERNTYKAAGNRLVSVFPGSALYARGEPQKKRSRQRRQAAAETKIDTSRNGSWPAKSWKPRNCLRAPWRALIRNGFSSSRRIAAKLTHQNPHWNPSAGNVLVEEIITLHGLEVQRRKVAYGNINPKDATAIFIRSALGGRKSAAFPQPSRR